MIRFLVEWLSNKLPNKESYHFMRKVISLKSLFQHFHQSGFLQNTSNNGGTWNEFGVNYEKVYEKKKVIKEGSTSLWDFAENLIDESVEKGILKK